MGQTQPEQLRDHAASSNGELKMPLVRASFAWAAESVSDGYHIFHGSTQIADVTGIGHEMELDLPFGTHDFSIRGYNVSGEGPLSATTVELIEPMPPIPVPGPVEGLIATLTLIDDVEPSVVYDLTAGGTRTPPYNLAATFQFPIAPATANTVTVTSQAQLNNVSSGTRYVIRGPANGGQSNYSVPQFQGTDIDFAVDNDTTLTVQGNWGQRDQFALERFRMTGGNIVNNISWNVIGRDILFDNVRIVRTSNNHAIMFRDRAVRVAVINSTIINEGFDTNSYAIYFAPDAAVGNSSDLLIAGNYLVGQATPIRITNPVNERAVMIDNYLGECYQQGIRWHRAVQHGWFADNIVTAKAASNQPVIDFQFSPDSTDDYGDMVDVTVERNHLYSPRNYRIGRPHYSDRLLNWVIQHNRWHDVTFSGSETIGGIGITNPYVQLDDLRVGPSHPDYQDDPGPTGYGANH